jgi:hypothetical protein
MNTIQDLIHKLRVKNIEPRFLYIGTTAMDELLAEFWPRDSDRDYSTPVDTLYEFMGLKVHVVKDPSHLNVA